MVTSNKDRKLRVLVCSANLGNARPDEASIAAWIPEDGNYRQVVESQEYPLPNKEELNALMKDLGLNASATAAEVCTYPMPHTKRRSYEKTNTHDSIAEMEEESDDESLHQFDTEDYFDVIAIGLQEATFEVSDTDEFAKIPIIQPFLSKTVRAVEGVIKSKDYMKKNKFGADDVARKVLGPQAFIGDWLEHKDTKVLQGLFLKRLPSYQFAVRYQRGEMRLEILTHRRLDAEAILVRAQNTGLGMNGIMNAANKGGIVAQLLVENSTLISFCSVHLQAHEGSDNYSARCRMAQAILDGTSDDSLGQVRFDVSLFSHVTFFLGDLNFRTDLTNNESSRRDSATVITSRSGNDSANLAGPLANSLVRKSADKGIQMNQILDIIKNENWRELNRADELFRALRNKDCLFSFKTLPCYFPPTFKVQRQAGFDYKDNRRPSYCDRILWRTIQKMEDSVMPMAYEPIPDFVTSDHKPIRGAFEIQMNEIIRPKPPLGRTRMSMSTRNLMVRATRRSGGRANQRLHLCFSDLRAGIKKRTSPPDPYISFITFPKELVQSDETNWERFKGRLRMGANLQLETKMDQDGSTIRTVHGFPRTRKLKSTYHPDWRQDGVQIVLRTHDDKTGKPLDMTGAILMITLMDHSASPLDGSLIGAFPLNLGHICMSSTLKQQFSPHEPNPNGPAQSSSSSGRPQAQRRESFGSILSGKRTTSSGASSTSRKKLAPSEVRTLHLKQPIMKNGRHTGWVSCSIDAWWLDATAAESRKSVSLHAAKRRHNLAALTPTSGGSASRATENTTGGQNVARRAPKKKEAPIQHPMRKSSSGYMIHDTGYSPRSPGMASNLDEYLTTTKNRNYDEPIVDSNHIGTLSPGREPPKRRRRGRKSLGAGLRRGFNSARNVTSWRKPRGKQPDPSPAQSLASSEPPSPSPSITAGIRVEAPLTPYRFEEYTQQA